jgi:hypothetical protein
MFFSVMVFYWTLCWRESVEKYGVRHTKPSRFSLTSLTVSCVYKISHAASSSYDNNQPSPHTHILSLSLSLSLYPVRTTVLLQFQQQGRIDAAAPCLTVRARGCGAAALGQGRLPLGRRQGRIDAAAPCPTARVRGCGADALVLAVDRYDQSQHDYASHGLIRGMSSAVCVVCTSESADLRSNTSGTFSPPSSCFLPLKYHLVLDVRRPLENYREFLGFGELLL